MPCCHCQGVEAIFDARVAARELRQYRRRGPRKTTRLLLDALRAAGVRGRTLLDVGGGVGVIQHELVREEAARQGHAERLRLHRGDFVDLAPELPPADIVTLDRVICCYPDLPALVGLSAAHARRVYG